MTLMGALAVKSHEVHMKRKPSRNLLKILLAWIFLALAANLILSGCFFTREWNDKIDQQVVWRHDYWDYCSRNVPLAAEPIAKDVYGSYYKGEYTGIKQLNNQKFYSYIFPNQFHNSRKRLMEILIPVNNNGSMPIIRTFNQYLKHKEYTYKSVSSAEAHYKGHAYLRFVPMPTSDLPAVNPKFIADVEAKWYNYYHFPNYFSDAVFSTDQPSLLELAVISSNAETTISYGYRSKGDATVSGNDLRDVHVCPSTTNESDALARSQQSSDGCDRWIWSHPLRTQFTDLNTQGDDLEATRRYGYFITVPLDIVTFPVQAVVVMIWTPVALLFQH